MLIKSTKSQLEDNVNQSADMSRAGGDVVDTNLAIVLDRFVRRIHVGLQQRAPQFDTERIGPNGALILLTLAETGRLPLHALTRRLARDKSQMARAVRSLERKGLLSSEGSPDDQRVNLISLTAAGQAVVETHRTVIAETIDAVLSPLPDEDRRALEALLKRALA